MPKVSQTFACKLELEFKTRSSSYIKSFPKSTHNHSKHHLKPSQNLPKTLPEPSKIHPKLRKKAFWTPSWPHTGQELNLGEPKNHQKAFQNAQRSAQTVPNPSQIEPKTLPNPMSVWILDVFLSPQILHGLFVDFSMLLSCSNPWK